MGQKILVVDDDTHMRGSITEILTRQGHKVIPCSSGESALTEFNQNQTYNLIVSDIKMPGMSGVELLEEIKKVNEETPFIVMTAFGDINLAVDAMKKGAYDFIEKGMDLLDKLEFAVSRALEKNSLVEQNSRLKTAIKEQWSYVGDTQDIVEIKNLIEQIARSKSTVLVTGESGTGKELIARAIHCSSNRSDGPFVKINCAALPEGLIESELFGHEKGAFTGAIKNKAGKFELASGGTLLLDEIGEMPIGVQAKLLRVLQEKEVTKIGADSSVNVDVRIVATTNRNLLEEVEAGNFREDLYYRLNVFHIELPPLRNRPDDIEPLVYHFIEKYNEENGFSVSSVEDDVIPYLRQLQWKGNIRELENSIERAVVLTRSGALSKKMFTRLQEHHSSQEGITPGMSVAECEKVLILRTLEHCNQNRTKTAELLDISIRTLRNKLNEYGVSKEH